jgi:hypothetical protein
LDCFGLCKEKLVVNYAFNVILDLYYLPHWP